MKRNGNQGVCPRFGKKKSQRNPHGKAYGALVAVFEKMHELSGLAFVSGAVIVRKGVAVFVAGIGSKTLNAYRQIWGQQTFRAAYATGRCDLSAERTFGWKD